MSTGVSLTLEQDGRKSGGAMPQVRKVETPLTPPGCPGSVAYGELCADFIPLH